MPKQPTRRPREFEDRESFEDRTTASLQAQDELLDRLERKLESPILNGGFDRLVQRVEKIDQVTEKLREGQAEAGKKIDAIHTVVLDPETGLYHKVKSHSSWIDTTTKGMKWIGGLIVAGLLTGAGKLIYDALHSHLHYTP